MKIKIIYASLVFSILFEMAGIVFFAYGLSVGVFALMITLQVVICIIVGMAATRMDRSLRLSKKAMHQLDRKIAEKSSNLAMLSHDMRSPVSGICQMSRLIHNRLDDPELKRLQKLVMDSSEQLLYRLDYNYAIFADTKNDIIR